MAAKNGSSPGQPPGDAPEVATLSGARSVRGRPCCFLGSSAEISGTHWRNLSLCLNNLDLACSHVQAVGRAPNPQARGRRSIVAGTSYPAPGFPAPAKEGRRRDEPKLQLGYTWPWNVAFQCTLRRKLSSFQLLRAHLSPLSKSKECFC